MDEWELPLLDLDAYLARIGYGPNPGVNAEALRALHQAHLATIPFENVDIALGRGIRLDLGSLQSKLVRRHRGGYCYEHNLLFAAALERLGYDVVRLAARVRAGREQPAPRTHMMLLAEAGGKRWVSDVGFGNGLLEPLPLEPGGPIRQGDWTFTVEGERSGINVLRSLGPEGWAGLYSFTLEPQHQSATW